MRSRGVILNSLSSWERGWGEGVRRSKPSPVVLSQREREIERLLRDQLHVTLRPAIAEELPGVADLADHVEIQIGNHERVLVTRPLRNDLPTRIAEVALSVEFADVPG